MNKPPVPAAEAVRTVPQDFRSCVFAGKTIY